jgi:hypothetical protein
MMLQSLIHQHLEVFHLKIGEISFWEVKPFGWLLGERDSDMRRLIKICGWSEWRLSNSTNFVSLKKNSPITVKIRGYRSTGSLFLRIHVVFRSWQQDRFLGWWEKMSATSSEGKKSRSFLWISCDIAHCLELRQLEQIEASTLFSNPSDKWLCAL